MLALDDLSVAIEQLTGRTPELQIVEEHAGKRTCPRCTTAMTGCHIRVVLGDEIAKPRPELDRCTEHGFWFDGNELAKVFEKSLAKVSHHGLPVGWAGNQSGFAWWHSGQMR